MTQGHGMTPEELRARIAASRAEQGLPEEATPEEIARVLAVVLAPDPGRRARIKARIDRAIADES